MVDETNTYDSAAWALLDEGARTRSNPDGELAFRVRSLLQHADSAIRERAVALIGLRWKYVPFYADFNSLKIVETDVDVLRTLLAALVATAQSSENAKLEVLAFLESISEKSAGSKFFGLEDEASILKKLLSGEITSQEFARRPL